MSRRRVDFPAPEEPASETCSPGYTTNEASSNAVTVRPSMLCSVNDFETFWTSRIGSVLFSVIVMSVPPQQVSGYMGDADLQVVDLSVHLPPHDRVALLDNAR